MKAMQKLDEGKIQMNLIFGSRDLEEVRPVFEES